MNVRPTLLLVDDDPAFTRGLMRMFHQKTCVATVIAETLSHAANYIDDPRLHLDAVVTDLNFVTTSRDKTRGLWDGLDFAAYVKKKRKGTPIFVVSVYAADNYERSKASLMNIPIANWYQKLHDGQANAPLWHQIEADLLKRADSGEAATMRQPLFDVFLAHNSQNKPVAEQFAAILQKRGIRPWFDVWHMPAGRLFQEEIEATIATTRAVAVLIGPDGVGPWEAMETRVAITTFVRRRAPVIPVVLPGTVEVPSLPLFLQEFSRVNFAKGWDDDGELNRLLDALK